MKSYALFGFGSSTTTLLSLGDATLSKPENEGKFKLLRRLAILSKRELDMHGLYSLDESISSFQGKLLFRRSQE